MRVSVCVHAKMTVDSFSADPSVEATALRSWAVRSQGRAPVMPNRAPVMRRSWRAVRRSHACRAHLGRPLWMLMYPDANVSRTQAPYGDA